MNESSAVPAARRHLELAAPPKESCRACNDPRGLPCFFHTEIQCYPSCRTCGHSFSCHFMDDGDSSVGLAASSGCGAYCDHADSGSSAPCQDCRCEHYSYPGILADGHLDEPEGP